MRAASAFTSRLRIAIGRQRDDAADRLADEVGQHQQRLADADVDRDHGPAMRVDVEEGRLAAAHGIAGRALDEGAALEQLVDDEADLAAADAHRAGEVGAGEGLPGAHQIEDDGAVDLARGAPRGDSKAGRVDLSHSSYRETL